MNTRIGSALWAWPAILLLAAAPVWGQARLHLDHVTKSLADTPAQLGLVSIAEQEAEIVGRHAQFAVTDLEDLANIQRHTRHVRHAIDPSTVAIGPGKGYGLVQAARGIVTHMELAVGSGDASESTKLHGQHVLVSAGNIIRWAEKINSMGYQITGGASPIASAYYAERILEMIQWVVEGHDADGDGTITWMADEGGLAQIKLHLGKIVQ